MKTSRLGPLAASLLLLLLIVVCLALIPVRLATTRMQNPRAANQRESQDLGARVLEVEALPGSEGVRGAERENDLALPGSRMPKTMARIGAQIATLSSETLDESTANLADISFYQWPGASLDAGSLNVQVPLVTDIEENELATILSNRRVIKVLQGLRRMNSSDREALMSTIFTEAFSRYEQLYAQEWERLEKTVAEYRSKGVVPGWMLDEGDVDHVRLPGARNEVLALCLIAGALETESAYPDILRLTQVAIDQRDAAYELSKQPGGDMAIAHLAYYSIYVRSILGTALLRTAPITYSQIEELPKKVVRLAVFDASLTPFDYPTHYGYRPDFSRGMIQIEIVYPLDDNALTAILDELNPVPIDITGLR